jgi:hypothetical protein
MSESLQDELAALRGLAEQLPAAQVPGVPIGRGTEPGLPAALINPEADALRWSELERQLPPSLGDRRVLVVGGNAELDAAAFRTRGEEHVVACEGDWEGLAADRDGRFEIVHCNDLLHRVLEPMTLLRRLRALTAPGGTLLMGSMMLADPERSEYLRFIPSAHAGDANLWFIPGRLAFRWMVGTAGYDVEAEFGLQEGPRERFPILSGYLRATAR